jgi:hypothetical protein
MKNLFFFLLIACAISGCSKYETQFDGPYSDEKGYQPQNIPYEILYVGSDGKMYMLDAALRYQKTFPTITNNVFRAVINYTHDKIAYKSVFGNIIVIDTAGTQIREIAGSSNADIFDFHPNNETVYYLPYGGAWSVKTSGPTVPIARTSLSSVLPLGASNKITGLAIKSDGSMVVTLSYYLTTSTVREYQVINANNTVAFTRAIGDTYMDIRWLRMSQNGETVLYGSNGQSSVSSRRGAWTAGFTNVSHNQYNSSAEEGAISPDGKNIIVSSNGTDLSMSNGKTYKTKTYVSCMDW